MHLQDRWVLEHTDLDAGPERGTERERLNLGSGRRRVEAHQHAILLRLQIKHTQRSATSR